MTYAELGHTDALLVDRIYQSHVVRSELAELRVDERTMSAALTANGNIEQLDRELRKVAVDFEQRRARVLMLAEDAPFVGEAESEFTDVVWWKVDDGAA